MRIADPFLDALIEIQRLIIETAPIDSCPGNEFLSGDGLPVCAGMIDDWGFYFSGAIW